MTIEDSLRRYIKLSQDPSMTSVDVAAIVAEIAPELQQAVVDNIYQDGRRIGFKLRTRSGKRMLLMEPAVRVHYTTVAYKWSATNFAMMLRKHLVGKRIEEVRQHEFDRIIVLSLGEYRVIVELLKRGNFVVLRGEKVLFALEHVHMRDRAIYPGAVYAYPPNPPKNPAELNIEEFGKVIAQGRDLLRGLIKLGIGRKYAYEAVYLSGVRPDANPKDIAKGELEALHEAVRDILTRATRNEHPCIYLREGEPIFFSPIRLRFAEELGLAGQAFGSFSEALDRFFSAIVLPRESDELARLRREREKLIKRVEAQRKRIAEIEGKIEELQQLAVKIYENYPVLSDALSALRRAKLEKGLSWDEIRAKIEEAKRMGLKSARIIEEIRDDGTFVVLIDGSRVTLSIHKTLEEAAEGIYKEVKKLREKLQRAKEELKKSEEGLAELDERIAEAERRAEIIVREPLREWYMSYNWFVSSEGFLVVGGRDAKSNETLVKKHLRDGDVFLHAEVHGGSAVVVKGAGVPPPEKTLWEAAQFAASYSRAWKMGLSAVDVYWTPPDKVSFTPPSGQYLAKGGIIVSEKNYLKNVPLRLAIGLVVNRIDERTVEAYVISGPESAVSKRTSLYAVIIPGNLKKYEAAKMILKVLEKKASGNPVLLKALHSIKLEKIIERIPGPSTVLEV